MNLATARHCRHRRVRWRIVVPAVVAMIVLVFGSGVRTGYAFATWEQQDEVSSQTPSKASQIADAGNQ